MKVIIRCWPFISTRLSSKGKNQATLIPTATYSDPLTAPEWSSHLLMRAFHPSHFFSWIVLAWPGAPGGLLFSWWSPGQQWTSPELSAKGSSKGWDSPSGFWPSLSYDNSLRQRLPISGRHIKQTSSLNHLPQFFPHICTSSSHLILSFRIIYPKCILYISTQMISELTCPKLNLCFYSLDLLLWSSSLSQQVTFLSSQ